MLRREITLETSFAASQGQGLATPLALRRGPPAKEKRMRISIVRTARDGVGLSATLDQRLLELEKLTRGFRLIDRDAIGTSAESGRCAATISFEAAAGARAAQRHLVWLDGEDLVHVSATVDESERSRLEAMSAELIDLGHRYGGASREERGLGAAP